MTEHHRQVGTKHTACKTLSPTCTIGEIVPELPTHSLFLPDVAVADADNALVVKML
jgi:hypothetical protein